MLVIFKLFYYNPSMVAPPLKHVYMYLVCSQLDKVVNRLWDSLAKQSNLDPTSFLTSNCDIKINLAI